MLKGEKPGAEDAAGHRGQGGFLEEVTECGGRNGQDPSEQERGNEGP